MKFAIFATSVYAIQLDADDRVRFGSYLSTHGKSYTNAQEHQARFNLWVDADRQITAGNAKAGITFKLGHNFTSDLTPAEVSALMMPPVRVQVSQRRGAGGICVCPDTCGVCNCADFDYGYQRADAGQDWRPVLTPVKNQGKCGSCWSFADISAMEAASAIQLSQGTASFSEQLILDCNPWKWACNGGWPDDVFTKWMIPKKIKPMLSDDYPYRAARNPKCLINTAKQVPVIATKLDAWNIDNGTGTADIIERLVTVGPQTILIRADTTQFRQYTTGVLNDSCCIGDQTNLVLNHAVSLVGYAIESQRAFWVVRNSWGPSWGDGGYIRIQITKDGVGICGNQVSGATLYVAKA